MKIETLWKYSGRYRAIWIVPLQLIVVLVACDRKTTPTTSTVPVISIDQDKRFERTVYGWIEIPESFEDTGDVNLEFSFRVVATDRRILGVRLNDVEYDFGREKMTMSFLDERRYIRLYSNVDAISLDIKVAGMPERIAGFSISFGTYIHIHLDEQDRLIVGQSEEAVTYEFADMR